MHTIGRNSDGTWFVARAVIVEGTTMLEMIFNDISLSAAMRACSMLNGSGDSIRDEQLRILERCAHG